MKCSWKCVMRQRQTPDCKIQICINKGNACKISHEVINPVAFIILRCFILYFAVILAVRIMGKRQIGELQPSELVITILISELASMPIQDTDQPILSGILPIFTLAAIELGISLITLKSIKTRYFFYGKPIVMVYKGQIYQHEMERARVSIDDLTEAMRTSGVMKIEDIDYAILETNGNVSIISKPEKLPITPQDMKVKPADKNEMPDNIIIDGRIIKENMPKDLSDGWLDRVLAAQGVSDPKEIFLMTRDSSGKTFIVKKEKKQREKKHHLL